MKNACFAASLLLSVVAVLTSTDAHAAAGRTPGTFAISPSGSATYSIPIWAPPGPNGLRPNIALVYDSRAGGGSEGVGWSIAGLSSIYLCNQTIAQDGVAAAVGQGSPRFCMDGKRLRLTSSENLGTYGQDGTTYQTEIADFSNVTAHGSGPAYFTVQLRNGLTYEYGHTSDSQVLGVSGAPLDWMLDKVTDRAGNTMLITWVPAGPNLSGTTIPASISWTPTSYGASQYSYTMLFNYTQLANAQQAGYIAGMPIQNFNQLTSIEIQYGNGGTGSDVKAYMLDYSVSSTTGEEILSKVTECTDITRANCLSPTTMTYQPGQQGVVSGAASTAAGAAVLSFAFDLNGDGINDYIATSSGQVEVAFGSASGYQNPVSTPVTLANYSVGYIDGTTSASLLAAQGGTYVYYKWNGSSFLAASTGVSVTPLGSPFSIPVLADVNGDGLDDLIYSDPNGEIFVQLNTTPTGGAVQFAAPIDVGSVNGLVPGATINGAMWSTPGTHKFDFTGDGQADLLVLWAVDTGEGTLSGWSGMHFNGSGFTAIAAGASGQPGSVVDVGDYNDDGCMDILYATQLSISGCNGSTWGNFSFAPFVAVAGLNWDGGTRRAVAVNNGGQIEIYKSLGNTLGPAIATGIPYDSTRSYTVAPNPTGDGLDALAALAAPGSPSAQYYLHNGAGQPPDLLISVTDGFDNFAKPTYVSIARSNYTLGTATPHSGYQNYIGPMYVVNQVTYSDPSSASGGTYQQTFNYVNGWMSLQGRGFTGFNYYSRYDSRTGTYERFGIDLSFPGVGRFAFDLPSFDQAANQPMRYTYANTVFTTLDGTADNQRYFVYFNNVTSQDYQVSWNPTSGSSPGPLITTTSTNYTFDNWGNATTVAKTVTDNDPNSPYSGQQWTSTTSTTVSPDTGTNWCLNQPTQVVETRTSPGSSVTRTTGFVPDYAHCRMAAKTTEPGSSQYAESESYGYDSFGNLSDLVVTGVGISPARETSTNWGTTGQFPMTVTNPLSQTTTYNYNFALGFRTSAQDPNGIVTSWAADPFGRKQSETRPDGTSTAWSYSDCAGGCLIGSHGLVVGATVYNANATVQTDGTTYLDAADRPLLSNTRTLAAGYQRSEIRYDSLGRIAQRAIPCTWLNVAASCPYWSTYSYDLLNRRTLSQRPISSANPTLQTTSTQYSGRTMITTDPQGVVSTQITSVDGEMIRSIDNAGYYQNFLYDAYGSLLSVTDSLSNTLFTADYDYGIGAFQRDATDADLDLSTAPGQHRRFNYDALGELTSWSDAKGQSFSQTYDPLSRPLVRTEPDLVTSWTWGSSAAGHNIGQLQSVSAGSYVESYGYDGVGRLVSRSITVPSDATYEYDFAYNSTTGLVDTLTYPVPTGVTSSRLTLQYGYVNGFLSSVTDFNTGTAYWTANAANIRNQVTQETLGNHVVTNRSFDAVTGWPSSVISGLNGASDLQNDSYLFDDVGNLIERQNNNAALTEDFYYDGVYRLDHSTLGGASHVNLQMHYDPTGNITSRSDLAGGASWSYDPSHKHAVTQAGSAAFAYTYDPNGNVTSRDGYAVTWTSYNHPSSITSLGESVQFAYKQDHTRWKAAYSGSSGVETTYFIGDLLEKVVSAGSIDYRHYIYAGPTKIAIYSPTGSTPLVHYIREDHLGSVSGILNSDGTSYVKESFSAFGARRSSCTWSGPPTAGSLQAINAVTRHGFTWQTALGNMGLNDMNGRIEDAATGRFLSPDPVVQNPAFTQSFNRYSYVNNNPLTYSDPSGFDALDCQNGETHCTPVPACTGSRLTCDTGLETGCQGDCGAFWQQYYNLAPSSPGSSAAASAGSSATANGGSPGSADMSTSAGEQSQWSQNQGNPQELLVTADRITDPSLAFLGPVPSVVFDTGVALAAQWAAAVGMALFPSNMRRDRDPSQITAFHYTTRANWELIQEQGFIRPGQTSGYAWFTPTIYDTGDDAQAALALSTTPEGYIVFPQQNVQSPVYWTQVAPANGYPGGGIEARTPAPIPITGATWVPFNR
jgi:RHS repeat-associated protein